MNGATSFEVIVGDLHLVSELFPTEDESDLVNHDTFLLLKGLLHLQDSVLWVKVKALLLSCQSLK